MRSFRTEIKWGFLFTLATILWAWLLALLGYTTYKIAKYPVVDSLFFFIAIIIFIMAFRSRRNQQKNKLTWWQGVVTGLTIGLVIMVLSVPAQYLIHTLIMPEFFENSIRYAVKHHLKTQEEAEAYFNLKSYIKQMVIFAPIAGTVIGAVVGLIMKRK